MSKKQTLVTLFMCVGLALIKAGFFTYAFTQAIFPYLDSRELMISPPTIVSYVAMSLSLAITPLFSKYYGSLKDHPSVAVISTLVVTLGSLIGTFSSDPFHLDGFSTLSAICVGSASSWMYIIWGEMMSEFSYDRIKIQISISLVATFLLYLTTLLAFPLLSTILVIIFPLLSGVLMMILLKGIHEDYPQDIPASTIGEQVEVSPTWRKWLLLLGIPHLVLSIANTTLWSLSNTTNDPDSSLFLLLSFGFGALFAIFLVLIALDRESHIQISALTRYAIPMLILAPILIFLGESNWVSTIGFMLVCSTIVFADFLNWVLFCELAHENPNRRSRIIGWGRFFIHFGMLLGCVSGRFIIESIITSGSDKIWVLTLCLVVVVMTALTLFVNFVEEHRVNIIFRKLSKQLPYKAKLDQTLQPYFKNKYDLTPREFEILVFLHEGFSASQIQSQLFLSLNTVNTHTKRIYRKLGVHSKIELYNEIEKTIISTVVKADSSKMMTDLNQSRANRVHQ